MSAPLADHAELLPPWPGELVDVDGTTLHVRQAPAANTASEPAVLLHGLGGGSTGWTDLMELLRDRLTSYAPDMPGFGDSLPPPDQRYDVAAQARTIIALIETGEYGAVHLFGNSLGGAVATRVAAQRPDLVRTLTLISPALPDLRPRLAPTRLLVPLVPWLGPALMRRAATMTAEELAWQNLEGLYGDPRRIHPQRLHDIAEEIRGMEDRPYMQNAYLGALRGLVGSYLDHGSAGMWRQATKVRAPTLAVYGTADPFVSTRMAARAARSFRGCRVLMLAGIGHVAQLEAPDVVADAVRALLPADSTEAAR